MFRTSKFQPNYPPERVIETPTGWHFVAANGLLRPFDCRQSAKQALAR
jgi:hypothetical protein